MPEWFRRALCTIGANLFYFLSSLPFPPATTLVFGSYPSSLCSNYTISPARACLSIWLERFLGSHQDVRGPFSIRLSLLCTHKEIRVISMRVYYKIFAKTSNACFIPRSPVAEFMDIWLKDEVSSGIGLSYRPASHVLACRYDNPMPELTLSPSQGSMNSAAGQSCAIKSPKLTHFPIFDLTSD